MAHETNAKVVRYSEQCARKRQPLNSVEGTRGLEGMRRKQGVM